MSSAVRGVPGGGWNKQRRFQQPSSSKTPGPNYDLPTSLSDHLQGHLYKQPSAEPSTDPKAMPHPSKDRTAWMIGMVKADLAYYSNIAGDVGPARYQQDVTPIRARAPTNIFSRNPRFQDQAKQYINKEMNLANMCTAGPGPKYLPRCNNTDLQVETAPSYTFRSKDVSDRSAFLNQMVKNGYIYQARPATSAHTANVGPSNYAPSTTQTMGRAPRPIWTKADRFGQDKLFISHKHAKAKPGLNSPGPVYNPTNLDCGKLKKAATSTPQGKWCP